MTRVPPRPHAPETEIAAPSPAPTPGPATAHDGAQAVGDLVRQARAWIDEALTAPDVADRTGVLVDAAALARLERRIEDLLRAAFPSAPSDLDLEPGWLAIASCRTDAPAAVDAASREARRTLRLHAHIRNLIERSWSEAAASLTGKVGDVLLDHVDVGDAVLALAGLPRSELEAGLRRHEHAIARGHLANLAARARQELLRRVTRETARLARACDAPPPPAIHAEVPASAGGSRFAPVAPATAAWAQAT